MGDINDIDDSVEKKIAQRRHMELLGAVNKIPSLLKPKEDDELKNLIRSHGKLMGDLGDKIASISKIEIPKIEVPKSNVTVNTDNKEIVDSLNEISEKIIASNEKLISKIDEMIVESKRGKKFDMKIKRNNWSQFIDSINGSIS